LLHKWHRLHRILTPLFSRLILNGNLSIKTLQSNTLAVSGSLRLQTLLTMESLSWPNNQIGLCEPRSSHPPNTTYKMSHPSKQQGWWFPRVIFQVFLPIKSSLIHCICQMYFCVVSLSILKVRSQTRKSLVFDTTYNLGNLSLASHLPPTNLPKIWSCSRYQVFI